MPDFNAGSTEQGAGCGLLAGGEEDAIAGLGANGVRQTFALGIGKVLGYRASQFAVFLEEDVG
ncbi:hypothetical protein D3C73_1335190 [compost metagenome]